MAKKFAMRAPGPSHKAPAWHATPLGMTKWTQEVSNSSDKLYAIIIRC